MKTNRCLWERLSRLASSGYLTSGRGVAHVFFDNMNEADAYVQSTDIENTRLLASYWPLTDRTSHGLVDYLRRIEYEYLQKLCTTYDVKREFVFHVTIRVETHTSR
jgi:hypothetical protein